MVSPDKTTLFTEHVEPAPESHAGALEVRGLEVTYNRAQVALHGVSVVVAAGEIVAVLGPNGAGKSTLLRAVSGFLRSEPGRVTGGSVSFDGRRLNGMAPHQVAKSGIAIVPEDRAIFPRLSVRDNLRLVTVPRSASARRTLDQVHDLFPVLATRSSQKAGLMSGGERKMLAVARALLLQPRVLLVDELSFGLAPIVVEQMMTLLADINANLGTGVLLVEQNAIAAMSVAHRAYIIETGQVVMDGTGEQLLGREDVKRIYLGLGSTAAAKSYSDVKTYRNRRLWS